MLTRLAKLTEKVLGEDHHHGGGGGGGGGGGSFSSATGRGALPAPSEAQVYKNLLIDLQYNQLLVSREYQALFAEQTAEIRRLRGLLPPDASANANANEDLAPPQPSPTTPLREMSPEDMRVVLREWERKLKANIVAKTEALAEAAMHRETVEALVKQLEELRSHVRKQDEVLKRQSTLQGALDRSRVDHQAAMEQLMIEFNKVSGENEEAKYKASQLELEVAALRRKAESDAKAIEILKQTPGEGEHQANALTLRRYEQNAEADRMKIEELEAALRRAEGDAARVVQLDTALQGVTREFSESVSHREQAESSFKEKMRGLEEEIARLKAAHAMEHETEGAKRAQLVDEIQALTSARDVQVAEAEQLRAQLVQAQMDVEAARAQAALVSEAELDALRVAKDQLDGQVRDLQARVVQLEADLLVARAQVGDVQLQLQASTESLTAAQQALDKETAGAEARLREAKEEYTKAQTQAQEAADAAKEQAVNKIQAQARAREDELSGTIAKLNGDLAGFEAQAQAKLASEVERVTKAAEEAKAAALAQLAAQHADELSKAKKVTEEFRDMYARETQRRRQVHNELMDLKGNIRVFARARPVLPHEAKLDGAQRAEIVDFPAESGGKDLVLRREEGKVRFEFDAALGPSTTQQQVFDEVAPFIVSVMDGVNVTLFAYGQTGSGKTFTMNGDEQNPGVNTRALERVFQIRDERAKEAEYWFEVSVLEVYLETVRDLLAPGGSGGASGGDGGGLDIRLHPDTKQVYVPGLTRTRVQTLTEIHALNREAWKNRAVGSHNMNEHSSRSHMVFTLTVHGKSLLPGQSTMFEGNLNLIDLAGSERLSKTDASGERLKEAQAINKSLSALADVISALGERGKTGGHIPFRNTKLTFLLQDQLGGSAKVGFFANLSPVEWNASETLSTLRFAERCRKTELGRATKNVVGDAASAAEIARLKKVIEELRAPPPPRSGSSPAKAANVPAAAPGPGEADPLDSSSPTKSASAPPPTAGSSVKRAFQGQGQGGE